MNVIRKTRRTRIPKVKHPLELKRDRNFERKVLELSIKMENEVEPVRLPRNRFLDLVIS